MMLPDDETIYHVPYHERIFCNRSLTLSSMRAIGFDMDYTLARYSIENFEVLAYAETVKKLVYERGYPSEMLAWVFDPKYMIRGLVVDKKLGHILKMDKHRYVKIAYNGFRLLSHEERRQCYDLEDVVSYEEPNFSLVDSFFSLPETYLFAQLVELKKTHLSLANKEIHVIFDDIRFAMDLSHRDGSLKDQVTANPAKFILKDPALKAVFKNMKERGFKTFLLTNSLWLYTNSVMTFLLGKDWTNLFDVVITGAHKPNFFAEKHPIYKVDTATGYLQNCENSFDKIILNLKDKDKKIFQGGHVKLLHDLLEVDKGSQILYVGDHIYGDILRSKKGIGWRTMLVVEELDREIHLMCEKKLDYLRCIKFITKRNRIEEEVERLHTALVHLESQKEIIDPGLRDMSMDALKKNLAKKKKEYAKVKQEAKREVYNYHQYFHPIWGQLFKTGTQNSRFASQVSAYACLYTSRFTNLRHYGTNKGFRAMRDLMPHDEEIFQNE